MVETSRNLTSRQKLVADKLPEIFAAYKPEDPSLSVKKFAALLHDFIEDWDIMKPWNIHNIEQAGKTLANDFAQAFDYYRREFKNNPIKLKAANECSENCKQVLEEVNLKALKVWEQKAKTQNSRLASWAKGMALVGAVGGGLVGLFLNRVIDAATFGVSVVIFAILAILESAKTESLKDTVLLTAVKMKEIPRSRRSLPLPLTIKEAEEVKKTTKN
jgi:hypothetical protein